MMRYMSIVQLKSDLLLYIYLHNTLVPHVYIAKKIDLIPGYFLFLFFCFQFSVIESKLYGMRRDKSKVLFYSSTHTYT